MILHLYKALTFTPTVFASILTYPSRQKFLAKALPAPCTVLQTSKGWWALMSPKGTFWTCEHSNFAGNGVHFTDL